MAVDSLDWWPLGGRVERDGRTGVIVDRRRLKSRVTVLNVRLDDGGMTEWDTFGVVLVTDAPDGPREATDGR